MINQIIAMCFRRRHLVWVIALLLAALGYGSWKNMAVEAYPDLSDVTAQVTTQVPGLAAEEVEQQITTPLERALSNTPGLVTIRSSSTFALSLITLVFKDGSEDYFSRQRVLERIAQVTLPQGVTPSLDPVSSPNGEIYRYTLESDVKNLMELSEIQRWTVIPALRQVTGVVDVNNFGGFTKEFRLELDPHQMDRFGVVLNDVTTAINANSANEGGGRIARGEQSYVVRGIGQVHSLDDLGHIVVKQSGGTPVLVSDLGKLSYGHQEREGILGKDANPDTVEGIVLMLKYQNASEVLKGVHAKVDQLNRKLAADNVRIVPYIDRDDLVQLTVTKVGHTVLEGVGLVCIVLILFLGSPRSAIVAAVAIPMALVSVFIFMNLTKMPANLFSLGAIDFGIIVDGAIVVMETLLRRREATPDVALTDEDVLETLSEVGRPIFFATLIIITAYFPLFAFQRAEAKLFSPMAFTVSYALFGALVCALLLIPGLAFAALKSPQKAFKNRPLMWLTVRYQKALTWLLARTWVAYLAGTVAMLLVLILGATAGREFLPNLDEGTLWLQVQMPTGLSLDKASEMAGELRRVLRSFPEVSYAITQLGRSDDGTDPWTPSHIEAPVGLKPYAQWPDRESKDAFIERLNKRLEQLPGFSVGISQPIIDGVNDAVGGAHSPLVLRVYGADLKEDRRIATEIVTSLSGERGTASISIFQEPPIPQLVVKVDRVAAARYGINAADIASLIQTAVGGAPVSQVYVEDRIYNVTAVLPRADKSGTEAIGNLLLNSSSGARILLSQVADIHLASGESTIAHEMNERELTIRVDNRDRDLASYLSEAEQRIARDVRYDKHRVHLEWAGQFENQRRAQARLIFIMSLVLLAMAALLFINFGKVRQVVLVLGVVPLATLGGLISLHVTGETLNVATAVGFIALFGVSVQNAIIMVANFRRILGTGVTLEQSVVMGAVERLRPVLMTATVASIGMLPAALATGVGTDVQRNLATVVVGGLVVSTFLTLLLVPAYYYSMERLFASKRWGKTLRRNR
jgi:cobalt-zinc-cadmium resistance protein CzcA